MKGRMKTAGKNPDDQKKKCNIRIALFYDHYWNEESYSKKGNVAVVIGMGVKAAA